VRGTLKKISKKQVKKFVLYFKTKSVMFAGQYFGGANWLNSKL